MSRIAALFDDLRRRKRKALVPYVTAGFPERDSTVPILHALVEAGSDILELGVPFSDPMADGEVVQRASEKALAHGVSLADCLTMVGQFRQRDAATPVVLMGYANPIEAMGVEHFLDRAQAAGVDGVIVVDYPPEECEDFARLAVQRGIDPIFLLAPTSSEQRIAQVGQVGRGYIYYVSLKGVTGAGHLAVDEVVARVPGIRAATRLPVGVGFGIRDAETARRVAEVADAVVIGSRIIQEIEQAAPGQVLERLRAFIKPIRAALDAQ